MARATRIITSHFASITFKIKIAILLYNFFNKNYKFSHTTSLLKNEWKDVRVFTFCMTIKLIKLLLFLLF